MAHGHNYRESTQASVTSINDPEKRGRIRVSGEGITADGVAGELDVWIDPINTGSYGRWELPVVGDIVEVEYDSGNTGDEYSQESSLHNPQMRWRAAVRRDNLDVPIDFGGEHYGDREGFVSPGGGALSFSRETGEAGLRGTVVKLGALEGDFEFAALGTTLATWQHDVLEQLDAAHEILQQLLDKLSSSDEYGGMGSLYLQVYSNIDLLIPIAPPPPPPAPPYVPLPAGALIGKAVFNSSYDAYFEQYESDLIVARNELAALKDQIEKHLSDVVYIVTNDEEP